MQQGWARRRRLEADLGRLALQEAESVAVRPGRSWPDCRTRLEQLAYLSSLARRADENALLELGEIAFEAEDELRYAARTALAEACRDLSRKRRRTRADRHPQPRRADRSASLIG